MASSVIYEVIFEAPNGEQHTTVHNCHRTLTSHVDISDSHLDLAARVSAGAWYSVLGYKLLSIKRRSTSSVEILHA